VIIRFKHTIGEVIFKQTTTTLLKSFGVAQRVTTQHTVLNMYQEDTRKTHNKHTVLNLHQHDTRVDTQRLKTVKTRLLEMTA
jgi:hypothetical protein